MANMIIIVVLTAILGGSVWYLYRAKKRGQTCIGCPYAKACSGKCGSYGQKTADNAWKS